MFDLFRFMTLRPPESTDPSVAVPIEPSSDLKERLVGARSSNTPLLSMKQIAKIYETNQDFVSNLSTLNYYTQLNNFNTSILNDPTMNLESLGNTIQNIFQSNAKVLTKQTNFLKDKQRLHDSMIVMKLVSIPQFPMDKLILFIRLFNLIERVAAGDTTLTMSEAVKQSFHYTIVLPGDLFPLPSPLESVGPRKIETKGNDSSTRRVDLLNKVSTLQETLRTLSNLGPEDFTVIKRNSILNPSVPASSSSSPTSDTKGHIQTFAGGITLSLTLNSAAVNRFSPAVKSTLDQLNLDLTSTSIPQAIKQIRGELDSVNSQLLKTVDMYNYLNVVRIGNQYFTASQVRDLNQTGSSPPPSLIANLPVTHGRIKPAGIADLLVVKHQLLRYEPGEVSDIQNFLKGESLKRDLRRKDTVQESISTLQETTKTEERDLQSTDRFELQSQTENTIAADGNLTSGNPISSSYGPLLEFQSNSNTPVSGSQQVTTQKASDYAKDVTTRSSLKVTETVRQEVLIRTTHEFEEKTEHGIDNTKGTANAIGIYQWIDKIYQAQVFNYGKRLLYDIIIPEPSAFLITAFASLQPQSQELVKPDPFTLGPTDIDESNYSFYAGKYGATGITPPPDNYLTISSGFTEKADDGISIYKMENMQIPAGYEALNYSFGWAYDQINPPPNSAICIFLGSTMIFQLNPHAAPIYGSSNIRSEVNSLAVSLSCYGVNNILVTIDVVCKRTDSLFQTWQAKTYDAILQSYQKQNSDYEERLANQQALYRSQVTGRSPDENKSMITTELKKASITAFTYQYYDAFGAIEYSSQGYPQTDLVAAEAQGPYIRFFEQAFQWDQMVYFFYPYFWGRKDNWVNMIVNDDQDPLFAQFLKAGAARVLLPVQPGFETDLAHFMETGQIWDGGQPPDVSSPDYVSIIDEIKASEGALGTEVPQGDPWEIRLSTTLIKLSSDDTLPKWVQDANGNWQSE